MSDDQATERELDYLAKVQALTDEVNSRCQAIGLPCDVRDGLAEAIKDRSWSDIRKLHTMVTTFADEEVAALQAAQAALEAMERDEAAQAALTAWRGFLARADEHQVTSAA